MTLVRSCVFCAVIAACGSDQTKSPANETTPVAKSPDRPIGGLTGDTLDLVAVGRNFVPGNDTAPPNCATPRSLRIIFRSPKEYVAHNVTRRGCGAPNADSTTTESKYTVRADTLFIYEGDGDETFQWIVGTLTADSLIQISTDTPDRFVRRRATPPTVRNR
jgi:hypothetical protein